MQDNYLVKLKVLDRESAEDMDMMDASLPEEQREAKMKRKVFWRREAKKLLDQQQLKLDYGDNQQRVSTIFVNTVQAKRLNWGLEHDTKTHESYLFLLTN